MIELEETIRVYDRANHEGVHVSMVGDVSYRFVTNGHICVGVEAPGMKPDRPWGVIFKRRADSADHVVDAAKLRAWALEAGPLFTTVTRCEECDGFGVKICNLDHEHTCGDCHGVGTLPEPRWVRNPGGHSLCDLFGVAVNRRYVGRVMETLPDDVAEVTINVANLLDVVLFEAPKWRGAVMPIRKSEGEPVDAVWPEVAR